jgi:hypothetical protein
VKRYPIPRPTETAALANVHPRRTYREALHADLATTRRRRDGEGFTLVGHMLLRALIAKAGERS